MGLWGAVGDRRRENSCEVDFFDRYNAHFVDKFYLQTVGRGSSITARSGGSK